MVRYLVEPHTERHDKGSLTRLALCQDRREGGVARVVTRGPGAFRGPERHIF